mmetsp:Transcript_12784/g.42476  ORF Transcript_12784/g.42476 Transcript_12784/m.42476 type:complete len:169 (-) Transcript_12784:76-582(-)
MFNHSCSPNAAWEIDSSGCLRVVTTAEVPAGDELRITYTDPRQPAATRRARLRRHFFFDCDCDLCRAGAAPWVCALCGHDNARGEPRCGGGSSSTAAGSAAAAGGGAGKGGHRARRACGVLARHAAMPVAKRRRAATASASRSTATGESGAESAAEMRGGDGRKVEYQ